MAVAYQSFPLQQGQNVELAIAVVDSDGAAVDLAGASARFAMARTPTDNALVDSDASPQTATITFTDAANGLLSVYIDDSVLDGYLGDYYYEVKVTDISTNETIVTRGWMTFEVALT